MKRFNNKYTPGPWKAVSVWIDNEANRAIVTEDKWAGETICSCGVDEPTNMANAKLISQAPAMLNIIKRLLIQPGLLQDQMYIDQISKVIDAAGGFELLFSHNSNEGE